MKKPIIITAAALLCSTGPLVAAEKDGRADIEKLFTLKVKPMLSEKCFGCHGEPGKKIKGGLDVTTRDAFLKGGDEFSDTLVPGSSAKSFVMTAVRWEDEDYEMPPKKNDRLSGQQIKDLAVWIDAGAPWPASDAGCGPIRPKRALPQRLLPLPPELRPQPLPQAPRAPSSKPT